MKNNFVYPGGAEFAFTILDDTDDTTVKNGRPVYDFLADLGLRTTKTVWAFDTSPENRGPYFAGETLSSPKNLKWVHELAENQFEIAFHNATMGSSVRDDTVRALDFIKKEFGRPVRLHCNHGQNRENLHWGAARYNSPLIRRVFKYLTSYRSYPTFEGEVTDSPYYWADVAEARLAYIRAFTFRELNAMKIPPGRPYRDSAKQSGPLFFNTTDASDVLSFNKFVNRASIDSLRAEKGWAIISTHLGKGYFKDNKLNAQFKETMQYIASLPGWFVPVSEMLDFVSGETGSDEISNLQRSRMEYAHILDRAKGRVCDASLY